MSRDARITVNDRWIGYARVFPEVAAGETFGHENSLGLAEIAAIAGLGA